MKTACLRMAALAALWAAWASAAQASGPGYLSDEELAKAPIVVVAKWEKAPFTPHHKFVGTFVNSASSTQIPWDVDDVKVPCLWFLRPKRSWDEKDPREYLAIDHYRAIQPLRFEEYFAALASPDRDALVPRLLGPDDPEAAARVLRHICGGIWPWPFDPDEIARRYSNPAGRGPLLAAEGERVRAFAASGPVPLRARAVAVYAELKGKDCRPSGAARRGGWGSS
ncbi:MAG: hypothetical protein MUC63_11250 [Planctomycetes bacterium]|nr:hypothetical protein [Planctomycetota bacterium]